MKRWVSRLPMQTENSMGSAVFSGQQSKFKICGQQIDIKDYSAHHFLYFIAGSSFSPKLRDVFSSSLSLFFLK